MQSFLTQIVDFVSNLLQGGTLEIVLLIVIIIFALILFLVAIFILWKLLVLLGKGLLWLFKRGSETAKERTAAKQEAAMSEPPPVATGWGSSSRIGLRRALAEAKRLAGPDALRIVLIAGDGGSDLCRGLGLTPPGVGSVGIAVGGDTVLIDASKADSKMLRKLARSLPWHRPTDGIAVIVDAEGIPNDAIARTASFARTAGMRVALHFVLPSANEGAAWRIIDTSNNDGDEICTQLAADTLRIWLRGGSREGLKELAVAQARDLPAALDRALSVAPSSVVDIASLGFGGAGLRAAVAQTVERTRPTPTPGLVATLALGTFAVGATLAVLAGIMAFDRTESLRNAINMATREAAVPWVAEGVDAIPNTARVRRVAGLGTRLAELSDFSFLMPLAPLVPSHSAPEQLGAAFLNGYVLHPLSAALERDATRRLAPHDDPKHWMDEARVVGGWFAAWEGLSEDPEEVDIRALLASAFGGDKTAWPEGIDIALIKTDLDPPLPAEGGLDVDGLTELARSNFILTMQRWADTVYTNGPVAVSARRAIDRSSNWREQHSALVELRSALQDPAQQWLTASDDKPDHVFELRILGQAVALSLIGQTTVLEAKAAISRIRIDARDMAEYFLLPDIGSLLVRAGSGDGPSLTLTPEASAWVNFLDKIANAGFSEGPKDPSPPLVGLVTIDAAAVAEVRNRLQVFDQFSSDLPAGLPPSIAQRLVRELASELVVGVTIDVERAMRLASELGIATERAERRAQATPALKDLAEIETWLRERQGRLEAERVLIVRARVAEGVLIAANRVLEEEDPLGIFFDATADGNALVRRFERGLARLKRIHEELAEPFVESAVLGRGWSGLEWRDMGTDIAGYERGDADSTLSALEGMVQAYVENPELACNAPRPLSGRNDYLARALARFRAQMEQACSNLFVDEAQIVFESLRQYYSSQIGWLWPYSRDSQAPEISASTLNEFLDQLEENIDKVDVLDEPLVTLFSESMEFWGSDKDGNVSITFRIEWRALPGEETLAENIAHIEINGAEEDESGIYTWRYGAPFSIKMRLAKNSRYRFIRPGGRQSDEWNLAHPGNGSWLRVLSDLTGGAVAFETVVVSSSGARSPLRITARVTHEDGRPMSMPGFVRAR